MISLPQPVPTVLRRWQGPFTTELERSQGPSGAPGLGQVPRRLAPGATTTSICGYCSTGCALRVHLRDGSATNLTPDVAYPVNLGMACPKGWEALTPLDADDRATVPLLRGPDGRLAPVTWDAALAEFANRFRDIRQRHGPDSLAWIGTGQITNEEFGLLGAVARFGIGIRHGDGNTRQCMATAATAYKESFGFDAPPFTYADFEESDVLVFVGANPCIAHPILWQRVLLNPRKPRIIVIDPRRTETAAAATLHLPLRPKSDLTLLYGVAHLLLEAGHVDAGFLARHTSDLAAFREFVRAFTPDRVASETGLTVGQICRFAEAVRPGPRTSFWWTMGVNQGHEATRVAQAIINLALLGGHVGRPGTGPNSITGQCNAMGSRLFSNTSGLLAGHDFRNPDHRHKIAAALGLAPDRIPQQGGWAYDQILEGIRNGQVKGLWIIATNPAHSWIQQDSLRELLGKLEFLVVQDLYHSTETAQLANLVLPAAGWGEKDGTFINSERRIGVTRRVRRAPGQALSDFHIFRLVAEAFGCGDLFRAWTSPEAAFRILQRCTVGQPCDISGIRDYAHLDAAGGIQWPFPADPDSPETTSVPETHRRLFADGRFFTPDGRARFRFEAPRPVPEPVDAAFPLVLLTGRGTSAQWHTNTRTAKSPILRQLYPAEAYVELHLRDAEARGIVPGTWVVLTSRRGTTRARALVSTSVQPGQVFVPMHYPEINRLTLAAFDPYSRQPAYKHCAVQVAPASSASSP